MNDRLHSFDALDNFRDFGGYATVAGGSLHRGRLFRSGHQASVSDADLERLAALDIGGVVDLRHPSERQRQPSRRPTGFSGTVVEIHHDDGGEAPHLAFLKSTELTPDSGRRFMIGSYGRMPFQPGHVDAFARYFRLLAETDRPVLIHCAAGKDRTGLLAALTHHLMGVHHDDLIADYLLTNTAVDLEGRAPAIARLLEARTGRPAAHDAVVAFLGVEPAYLDTAIAAIEAQNGSLDGYFAQVLGMDAALRDRITARLAA